MLISIRDLGVGFSALLFSCCTCGKIGSTIDHHDAPLYRTYKSEQAGRSWKMTFPNDSVAIIEYRLGDSTFRALYSMKKNGTHEVER